MSDFPYLHGFSAQEQQRLRDQARFLEWIVYQSVNFFHAQHILEVGCGVGAQTEILLRRFPTLKVTGIDLNPLQLAAAQENLTSVAGLAGRYELHQMPGDALTFSPATFDGAFLCWILEHVPAPLSILQDVRRVLKPQGEIYVTEVLNSSFFLDPYSPNVWKFWMALNDYQFEQAGDPFVGAKLGNLLLAAGFHDIQTEVKTMYFDSREPLQRRRAIEYWSELILSAAPSLLQAGHLDQTVVDATRAELQAVAQNKDAVFFYSFIQARARA